VLNPADNPAFNEYLSRFSPEIQDLASLMRAIIRETIPDVLEMVDPPSGIVAFGFGKKYSHLVCAIAPYKTFLNLMFSEGSQLVDSYQLLSGSGKKARHVRISNEGNVNLPGIKDLLREAARRIRSRLETE
jgi:hypothetical protein